MFGKRLMSTISLIAIVLWTFYASPQTACGMSENGGRGQKRIETSFGLEVFLTSDEAEDIVIEEIDPRTLSELLDRNITLDIFFNIYSNILTTVDLKLRYNFDYSFGMRAASFYPETFTFSEMNNGVITSWEGAEVNMNEQTVTLDLNNFNVSSSRSITVTGELDKTPPEIVEIGSIEVRNDGEAYIEFKEVPEAIGYFLFFTEQKCVNIEGVEPDNGEPFVFTPVILPHLEIGEEVYISISAVDFAGNLNPQVDCHRFEMRMPNGAPIAKIDPMEDTYHTGELIYFTCRETSDPNPDDELSYSWDLDGDGDENTLIETPTFTYTTAAIYVIKLTVTDREGLKDSYTIDLEILDESEENEEGTSDRGKLEGINDYKWIIIGLMIFLAVLITIIYLGVISRKRTVTPRYERDEVEKEKVKFLKRESPGEKTLSFGKRSLEEDGSIYWEPHPYRAVYEEWTHEGIDIIDDLGGDLGIAPGGNVPRFLPQRGTIRPHKKRRKARRGRARKKRLHKEKTPVVAAVVFPEEESEDKQIHYYSCPKCEEVLEVAVTWKGDPINKKIKISCPICRLKGDIIFSE